MKRVVCLLVIVSIAYAGCADKKPSKVTVVPLPPRWGQGDDWKSNAVLRRKIVMLENELIEAKIMAKPNKALLVRTAKLEAALESQRAVIENLKNVYRLHEAAIEYQRVALESLLNLCRLYEAKIESQREVVKDSKNIFGEFAGMYFFTSQANRNKTHVMN